MSLQKMYAFLQEIGIPIAASALCEPDCFVPGLQIKAGVILVDRNKLKYPGDLIHEAAHLAVVPANERLALSGHNIDQRPEKDGEEIAALLWSYLATKQIGIAPEVVFHPHGYKGDSQWLIDTFESNNYMGAPLLQWMGIVDWDADTSEISIRQWLRD